MFNRSTIMRSAWAEYRREYRGARFDRSAFAAILRQRWTAARVVGNRAGIMVASWASYRAAAIRYACQRFDRRLFGRILRMAWINARAEQAQADRIRRAARPVKMTPRTIDLDAALETVRYLPAHMSSVRAIADIHARYAC